MFLERRAIFQNNGRFTSNLTFSHTFQKHFNFSPLELIFGEIFCWGEIWAIIQRILAKLKHFFSILQQANALQCDVCLKIFSRESSLKRHLVTVHIGVRAFQCFLCGRAFTQSGNMRAHQQAVHFFSTGRPQRTTAPAACR